MNGTVVEPSPPELFVVLGELHQDVDRCLPLEEQLNCVLEHWMVFLYLGDPLGKAVLVGLPYQLFELLFVEMLGPGLVKRVVVVIAHKRRIDMYAVSNPWLLNHWPYFLFFIPMDPVMPFHFIVAFLLVPPALELPILLVMHGHDDPCLIR